MLVSVIFPAWVWLQNASEKFFFASYASTLSEEHASLCLKLIQSDWYQSRWGHLYKLTNTPVSFFKNDKMGHRIATSTVGIGTGFGGSILIVDDPNNVKDGDSDAIRNTTNTWWNGTLPSRRNNVATDVRILIQQRTHDDDVTGNTMKNDLYEEWTKLIIPLLYEESRKAKTIILPMSNGLIWEDPRTVEGESLSPGRWTPKVIASLQQQLGEYNFAGQYQQRPSPKGGGLIKKDWFRWWKEDTPPKIEFIIQSWDMALTDKKTSSYYACTTWGVWYDDNDIENVILLSAWRDRLSYPEARKRAIRLYHDYRDIGKDPHPNFTGRPLDMCLIEAKASGDPLIQDLMTTGIRATPFNLSKYKDKTQRVNLVTPLIESGMVWLRARKPHFERLMPDADMFVEACAIFPKDEGCDLVDTMTQALLKLKEHQLILNREDIRYKLPYKDPIEVY